MSKLSMTAQGSLVQAELGFGPSGGFVRRLVRLPLAALETLLLWQQRSSERRRLREMDDRLLKDMGLSRADAEREGSLPFWRAGNVSA